MKDEYLRVDGRRFARGGRPLVLRGFGLGSWLNLEHFMFGLPGSEGAVRGVLDEAYGPERAARFWEAYRTALVDEDDVRFLASLGVNSVRVPFNYHLFESDEAPGVFDPRGFQHLDRAVALCKKHGLLAILDLHAAPGGQNPDWHSDNLRGESLFWEYAEFRRRAIALWRHVAARYRGEPAVGGYDLLNEPVVLHRDKGIVDRFFAECIQEVRAADPDHLLFVQGDVYARDFTMFRPFDDPNVACAFHLYPFFYAAELPAGPDRGTALEALARRVVTLSDLQDRLARPIWCGETGAMLDGDRARQLGLLGDWLDVLERLGISWSVWAYKDARAMSLVHPAADSPWMRLAGRALEGWSLLEDFERGRRAAAERLARRGVGASPGAEGIAPLRLLHREMASEQTALVERLRTILAGIPFEELLAATASLRLDRCETWGELADVVARRAAAR